MRALVNLGPQDKALQDGLAFQRAIQFFTMERIAAAASTSPAPVQRLTPRVRCAVTVP